MIEEFRPGFGRFLTITFGVLAVAVLVIVTVTGGVDLALLTLPWLCLFVAGSWAFFWRPKVVVSDAGVRLVNVTRTIDVPWPALVEVDTHYALTLGTAYGRFSAWAAPAPGAGTALRTSMRTRSPNRGDGGTDAQSSVMGDIEGTASGDAAAVVRRRWARLRDAGHLDDPQLEFERPPIEWHWRIGLAMIGLTAVSVATLFVS